jgi:protein transport protein SEC24
MLLKMSQNASVGRSLTKRVILLYRQKLVNHIDERSAAGFNMMIIPIKRLLKLLYPSLGRLDEFLLKGPVMGGDDAKGSLQRLVLSAERLDPRGAFLYDDGFRFVLWLGKALPAEFIKNLLGVEAANSPDLSKLPVIEQNNELSRKLLATLKKVVRCHHWNHCGLLMQLIHQWRWF